MAAVATTNPTASVQGTTDYGPANKRLRDEQDGSDPSDENTDDMDQASFTVVSYKKKRGNGVPVVFRPTMEEGSLWKVNPNIVASGVVTSAQEKVLNHRLNEDGSLTVTVSTLPAANRLLTVTELAGVAVEARVPYSFTANYGKIQDVSLSYSNEELQDYLRDHGVVSARRLTTFTPEDGGKVKEPYLLGRSFPSLEELARFARQVAEPVFRQHHYDPPPHPDVPLDPACASTTPSSSRLHDHLVDSFTALDDWYRTADAVFGLVLPLGYRSRRAGAGFLSLLFSRWPRRAGVVLPRRVAGAQGHNSLPPEPCVVGSSPSTVAQSHLSSTLRPCVFCLRHCT
ncbi:hypothetical protein MTO96_032393 [Rhipicephalus appendiculatus]